MATQSPLVSVIIPTYNMRQCISEAIDSVLAQTYPHCEIIVVDDGSTDETGDLLQANYGDQIRYVYQENSGRGAARNKGFQVSQGEYIQFFDADDIMEPNALEARLAFLREHPKYAVAYGHMLGFYDNNPGNLFEHGNKKHEIYVSGNVLKAEIDAPFLGPPMALIRQEWVERVDGFDETLERNEDWHFFLKIAVRGGQFKYVDGPPVARFRVRRTTSLDLNAVHLRCGIQALERIRPRVEARSDYRSKGLDQAIEQAIGLRRYNYGSILLKQGRAREGVLQVLRSFLENRNDLLSKSIHATWAFVVSLKHVGPALTHLGAIAVRVRNRSLGA